MFVLDPEAVRRRDPVDAVGQVRLADQTGERGVVAVRVERTEAEPGDVRRIGEHDLLARLRCHCHPSGPYFAFMRRVTDLPIIFHLRRSSARPSASTRRS